MAPPAVKYLADELRRDDVVLELGGGESTAWFAERTAFVHTIEPTPEWADRIEEASRRHRNVTVIRSSIREGLRRVPRPDILVIDHSVSEGDITRPEALEWAAGLDPAPRLIVLDDSDRPEYQSVLTRFASKRTFRGFRPHAIYLTETTVIDPS